MKDIFEYGGWRIKYDADLNRKIYGRISAGWADTCPCSACNNFLKERDNFYPQEFRNILTVLGIDYKKETEVVDYGYEMPIEGWFNFASVIEQGEQDLQYINNNFQVEIATEKKEDSIFTISLENCP